MVEEHADFDTACRGFTQGLEEILGHFVAAHDVKLDVNRVLCFANSTGHRGQRGMVFRQQFEGVARHHRHGSETFVHMYGLSQPAWKLWP